MKYEDYEAIARTLTAENAPDVVKQLLDNIKTDTESINALMQSNTEKDTKIRDLQDTNIKLFLSQTGKADDEPDEDSAEKEMALVDNEIESVLKGE